MSHYPTFSELWQLSNKVGPKELYAKHWQRLPMVRQIEIFKKVQSENKPDLKYYLESSAKIKKPVEEQPVITSDPGDEQPGHHLWSK